MNITFEQATIEHKHAIFEWLQEPHVQEFWDNRQGHKDDILNFMNGRKEPSSYVDGRYIYWVALLDEQPYALIMTIKEFPSEDRPQLKNNHLSSSGSTWGIDYMIGDKNCIGKGLGSITLEKFVDFFHQEVDPTADTFWIDPNITNPRAKHVYEKAGFEYVGSLWVVMALLMDAQLIC